VYDQQPSEPQYASYVPMMKFWEAVKTCFRKYFDFKGRARRSEYWWFILFTVIVGVVWTFFASFLSVGFMIGSSSEISLTTFTVVFMAIIIIPLLFLVIPQYAVMTRRLHDTGRSGWWVVASLVVSLAYSAAYIKACMPMWNQLIEDPDAVYRSNQFQVIAETLQTSPVLGGILCVLFLASLVLGITMLVFTILDSHRGVNKYGPSPKYQQ
jgi:uncharacterized membrane protein YhaH (DUF805 family)